jgi:NSS family neurotransmitter:Na+ symporter
VAEASGFPSRPSPPPPARERWSGQAGFVAATVGSAVGLGNIWRFPYVAGENGGGAFIVAYLIAVVVCGAPLMMFELAAGRRYAGGAFAVVRAIAPRYRLAGVAIALAGFALLSYYTVVAGWTLGYAGITAAGLDPDFGGFADSWAPTALFLLTGALGLGIVLRGVRNGIEAASRLLLPVLTVLLVAMMVYALTFEGRSQALEFLFNVEWAALGEPAVWARAIGQAFFSLGVGCGVLITYGSYMGEEAPVRNSAAVVASADTAIALIAGLAIFPLVFTFAVPPASGPQLAFDTLPQLFGSIGLGRVIGTAFYLLLFMAAITSLVSLIEGTAASLRDWRGGTRRQGVVWLGAAMLVAGLPSALSYSPLAWTIGGRPVLDAVDSVVGTYGLLAGGLVTVVALFWLGDPRLITRDIGEGARGRAATALVAVGRYLVTGALVAVLAGAFFTQL